MLAGKQESMKLGNLDALRDWGYAREYMEGAWKMLQQEQVIYIVGAKRKLLSI